MAAFSFSCLNGPFSEELSTVDTGFKLPGLVDGESWGRDQWKMKDLRQFTITIVLSNKDWGRIHGHLEDHTTIKNSHGKI